MKRRILSIITALALCLSLCPTWAFAAEADPALCPHHWEHTGECGYAAPTEGQPCGHQHTAECYTLGILPDVDGGDDYEIGADTENLLDCQHVHDSECGYVPADPGQPCGFVCRLCPIEDLIAALPEEASEDNAADVRGQLDHILALFGELTEDEQEQIDLSCCYALQAALDGANFPMPLATGNVTLTADDREVIFTVDECGNSCQGHTITQNVQSGVVTAAKILVESGTHDITFSGLNLTSAAVGIMPGGTMNLTLGDTNKIVGTNCGFYVPVGATLVITEQSTGSLDVSLNSSATAAGIGGAYYDPNETQGDFSCGTVIINGGTITAAGRDYSAGIGGASYAPNFGNGGNITITGGHVTATGSNGAPGIGGGKDADSDGSLTLSSADVLAENTTLGSKGTYTINGDPTEDMIVVPELVYTGEVLNTSGIKIDDTKTGTATYFGQTFTVNASAEGWELQPLGEVVNAGEYTAVFKKGDKSISKTFTVAQSGTQFVGDGAVETYKGDTQTRNFTASDTITVKATPTPTRDDPTKAAARLRADPVAGQMVVYVGTTQVSVPADKSADGSYTMTVSAADVLVAAGGPGTGITLTARFIENGNMAGAEGTVKVNISAAAKIENGSATTYVGESGLDAAFNNSDYAGATFTLLANVTRATTLRIKINCTLDLNGHNIKSTNETCLSVAGSFAVTIQGEGEIISEQIHALVVVGSVTLEGGTFTSNKEDCAGVYVNYGTLSVIGENVVIQNTSNGGYGLAVNNAQSVQLSAGTYSGTAGAIVIVSQSSSLTLGGLLAHSGDTRYAYFDESGTTPFTGVLGNKSLTGTVTVKKCNHTGEGVCAYVHNENTSTHTETCLACGNAKDAETCSYDATTGRCVCGSTLAVTLPTDLKLTYDGTAKEPAVTVTLDGTVLTAEHYTVAYANNKDAGTATVTVNGNAPYAFTKELTFRIAKKPVTAVVTAADKTYDGTPNATMSATVTEGILSGDSITISGVTGTFADENVGTDKTVTVNTTNASVTGVNAENYEVHYPETVTASITPIEVTLTFADQTIIYGETVTKATANVNGVKIVYSYTGTATGNDWPVNAGTYTITAKVEATGNYGEATATAQLVISKATLTATGATVASKTYNGNADASVSGVTFDGLVSGETLALGTDYTATGTFADANAGTGKSVTVAVALKDSAKANNYNLTNSSVSATGDVTKASQTAPQISGLPSGTITYGDTFALSAGSGVTWSASGAAAVDSSGKVTVTGTGKVTITATKPGDNNHYAAEDQITFTAVPKALTVTGLTAEDRAYDGTNAVEITDVALSGVVTGDAVSVNLANLTGTLNGSDVGTYTAVTLPRLTLTGGAASNYTLTQPAGAVPASVTIEKAPALTPKTGDLAVANKQEHTYTYGLGALRPDVPEGMSLGSTAVTYELGPVNLGSYYTSGALIDGQTLTLPIDAVESDKAEGIGTITIIIHTGNFEDMTATINVRSVNKIIPTGGPTLSANTLTYGQALSAITLRGDMADGTTPVPGTFAWSNPDNRPAVQENYAAAWTFKPDDNNKYAIVTGTALIQVLPAPITGAVIVLDHTAFKYDGQPHRPGITSVTLNGTPLTADVDYTAAIPEGTEAGTYTVTLTGKGNYTGTATAVFQINPVEQKPLDQKDDDGHDLRLEVETGLSTVPEALKNNAKYDTPAKIEAELRTQVEQVMSNVGENIAVFDVTLQYKDASGTWRNVDPNDFPKDGVTAILPYPAGTGATGYTFTVQHLISSGPQAGTMETLAYTPTADGLQCKFSSLSPVAIGYQAATKPNPQPNPGGNSGGGSGGGGWSSSTYAVTVEKSEHGKVTSNRTNASNGSTVTLTVTPDSGYVLDALTVTDSRGNEIKLTAQSGGKYTFTMPSRAVTVKASFVPLPDDTQKPCDGGADCPSHGFTDLGTVGTWYHEAVDYVLRNGLMNGYSNGTFGPNNNLTRAQFAQILFNKEGRPVVNYLLQYSDVAEGVWYTEAIRWATSQGVVGGYGNGMFGPNDNITREQLAVMLWRYAGSPAATDKELHFTDADQASGFALEALRWAVENGIISGYGNGQLAPQGLATRGQVAQMLMNFLKNR